MIDKMDKSMKPGNMKVMFNEINKILRYAGFTCTRYPSVRQRKKRKYQKGGNVRRDVDLLSQEFDKGDFTICQLVGSDENENHTVVINNQWIFDSTFQTTLPFNRENLDKCCRSSDMYVRYKECKFAYVFKMDAY